MFIKLYINNFDKNDNAQWMILTKDKNKIIKLCSGIFNFQYSWCGIFTLNPKMLQLKIFDKVMDCLESQDWDIFKPSKCHKSIKSLIRLYNKKKYGKNNPF